MTSSSTLTFRDPNKPGAPLVPRAEWDRAPWNRWTFQNVRSIVPTAQVWRGQGGPTEMLSAHQDIDRVEFELDGTRRTVANFMQAQYTDAFLVLHRGKVVAERYLSGMTARTPHLSQSVAKSIVGTVAGILIERGEIDPAAPLTQYLPELETTAYRGATVQHVLDMTSGVVFDETYTAHDSHMAQLDVASGWKDGHQPDWPKNVWELILTLKEAECPHGASFRYRSIETDALAFVLQRVSGLMLSELVSRELWSRMGAEEDAYFTVDPAGYALGDGGFNATLRDYGRFALLHLGQGNIGGQQVVPSRWIEETRHGKSYPLGDNYCQTLPRGSYHNQFWIEDQKRRAYMARGVFGQLIYIDPEGDFAAVILSSWPQFLSTDRTRTALSAIHAIRDALN